MVSQLKENIKLETNVLKKLELEDQIKLYNDKIEKLKFKEKENNIIKVNYDKYKEIKISS